MPPSLPAAVAPGAAVREVISAARSAGPVVAIHSDAASAADARRVMLAHKYEERIDPAGWWISEKLDGVRGYWDGRNFYSRLGNQFPAPDWFKEGLPPTALDGELWCGRRQFRRCLSIVRNRASGKLWEYITFLVFDAPGLRAPYEDRVAHIKRVVVPHKGGESGPGCPYAAPVGIIRCEGREHLSLELRKVDKKGGEGLMLRQPKSLYEHRRSRVLLKVKSVHDEEAKVVGHEGGRGAAGFHTGALTLETPDGRRFSCGSGMSATDRRSPPDIGTVVTFRYTELMDNGYPRFPVYRGPRIDLDWATVCAEYTPPNPDGFKAGELRREHSIMYSEGLQRTLTSRALAAALDPLTAGPVGDAYASDGSEGGDTEVEDRPRRARRPSTAARRNIATGAAEARAVASAIVLNGTKSRLWRGASSALVEDAERPRPPAPSRSRSVIFAAEAGLDLDTARRMLKEHDRSSRPS